MVVNTKWRNLVIRIGLFSFLLVNLQGCTVLARGMGKKLDQNHETVEGPDVAFVSSIAQGAPLVIQQNGGGYHKGTFVSYSPEEDVLTILRQDVEKLPTEFSDQRDFNPETDINPPGSRFRIPRGSIQSILLLDEVGSTGKTIGTVLGAVVDLAVAAYLVMLYALLSDDS